ncbi:unnamed protein product, partial [Staurois parvus]
ILTCCVQWFCTEQPGSSSSQVPYRLSWLLLSVGSPHSKQLAMGAPAAPGRKWHTLTVLANEEAETWNS